MQVEIKTEKKYMNERCRYLLITLYLSSGYSSDTLWACWNSKLCIPLFAYVHSFGFSWWFPTDAYQAWNVHDSGCSKLTANFDKLIYTHSPKHTHTPTHTLQSWATYRVKSNVPSTHTLCKTQNSNNNKRNWINKVKTSTPADNFSYSAWIVTPFSLFFLAAGGNQATKLTSFPQRDKANGRRCRRGASKEWHEWKALAMLSFPFLSVKAVNFGQHLKQMRWWAKV